jgi:hypothetical protein
MNLKKTALAAALTAAIGIPASASADTITMSFTGVFTLINSTNSINPNSDASLNVYGGQRTLVSGTGTFDTSTGSGSALINPFSFFGGGAATASGISFQAIGSVAPSGGSPIGPGTLVAGQMGFNWAGNFNIPVTAIFDAAGFFANAPAPGNTVTISTDCVGCATSATKQLPASFGTYRFVGAVPMAMTTFNTAGTTLGSLFPLSTDGIAGSPMTTAPFPGQNAAFDFTSMVVTNTTVVPVPAAVWLFGSGLLGLVGVARRRNKS